MCILESDPDGIDPHEPGEKLDNGKIMAGILSDFSRALTAVAEAGNFSETKYPSNGFKHINNELKINIDAMWRHLLADPTNTMDNDSVLLHAAQAAWNALARLEMILDSIEDKKDQIK